MTRYQQQLQRAYDRARYMVRNPGYRHREVGDAKAEAGLVGVGAQASRARGDQLSPAWS